MAPVTRVGPGIYRVDHGGRQQIVYVAGTPGRLWAFANGEVFREAEATPEADTHHRPVVHGVQMLTSPMPATIVKVFVAPGQAVRHGDTLVVVEAMKMELPIRAPGDANVKAVHCREGELVQPDQTLVELE
jgi:3-methylcrotonyl-CoA carboxylase alpha subunit